VVVIADTLAAHKRVGLDTSTFIYHVEAVAGYALPAGSVLRQMADGAFRGFTSVVTLMEIAVRPMQLGRPDIAATYEVFVEQLPNLTIVDIDRTVARQAAELRAKYRLHAADALQVAACLGLEATAFATNDKGLRRVQELDVLVLDEFVEP
jgi:predicted nucleic acid-binding protein